MSIALLTVLIGGCASIPPIAIGGVAGAATIGGIAYWLLNQPWSVKICYWVGNEAALKIMPVASTNVDADTIAVCGEAVKYLETAQGLPADVVNAELAARLSKLPPAQVAEIQLAASVLDEFLPAATSTAVLSAGELADIEGFLRGYADGTQTVLDGKDVSKALLKAVKSRADLQRKHAGKMKAGEASGWFVAVVK